MKKHQLTPNLRGRKMACTVSAAALMLGVSHAATVGFHFQSEWQGAPSYTGKIVTAAAFGIPTNSWENLAPLRTGYYGDPGPFATNQLISTSTSGGGLNPLPQGSLDLAWACTAANVTAFGGYDGGISGPNPLPGNQQVYYTFLRDDKNIYTLPVGGPIPYSLAISGLQSVWTNTPYVIEIITSSDTASSFANANIGSLVSTQQVTFSSTQGSVGNFGGISSVSGPMTNDSISIWSDPATKASGNVAVAGTIAGFIITDKPVVSMSPQPVGSVVSPGDTVTLRAIAVGVPPLSLHWRNNGVAVPGATNLTYVISNVVAGAGNYDLVVTNLYGSATSKVSAVTLDLLTAGKGNGYTPDSSGSGHDGEIVGATILASSTDGVSVTRNGVASLNATNANQIVVSTANTTDFTNASSTVMFWMRSAGTTNSTKGMATLFDGLVGTTGMLVAQYWGGGGYIVVSNATGIIYGTTGVSDNNWHHVAVVNDPNNSGAGCSIYIDGALANQGPPFVAWPNGQDLQLGLSYGRSTGIPDSGAGAKAPLFPYNGQLDDVRFYNRVLSGAEVASAETGALVDASALKLQLNFSSSTLAPGIKITWQNSNATLQSAPTVNGPWTSLPGAISPYNPEIKPGQAYYRYIHTPVNFVTNPYDQ